MCIADNASEDRRNPTEPERRLWRHLSNSRLGGFEFCRQHVIDRRIVDFFCPSIGLVIDADGHTHDAEVERLRDEVLATKGCTTLRFTNTDVMRNIDGVLETILTTARSLPPRDWRQTPPPQPFP